MCAASCHPLRPEQEPLLTTTRTLHLEAAQGVDSMRHSQSPGRQISQQTGLGCTEVCNRWTEPPENPADRKKGHEIRYGRNSTPHWKWTGCNIFLLRNPCQRFARGGDKCHLKSCESQCAQASSEHQA